VLVYSIDSHKTFDRIEVFYQSMMRVKRGVTPSFILVANKSDRRAERQVQTEEGERLAKRFGCQFIETSAKTASNVDEAFTSLIRTLRYERERSGSAPPIISLPPVPPPVATARPTKRKDLKKPHSKCIIT